MELNYFISWVVYEFHNNPKVYTKKNELENQSEKFLLSNPYLFFTYFIRAIIKLFEDLNLITETKRDINIVEIYLDL